MCPDSKQTVAVDWIFFGTHSKDGGSSGSIQLICNHQMLLSMPCQYGRDDVAAVCRVGLL